MTTTEKTPQTTSEPQTVTHRPVDFVGLGLFFHEGTIDQDPWRDRLIIERYAIDAEKRGIPSSEVGQLFSDVIQGPLTQEQASQLRGDERIINLTMPAGSLAVSAFK